MISASVWVLLSFLTLFLISGKKIWSVLSETLDKHTLKTKIDIESAKKLREEAEIYLKNINKLKKEAEYKNAEINKRTLQDIAKLQQVAKQDIENFTEKEQHHFEMQKNIIERQMHEKIEKSLVHLSLKIAEEFIQNFPHPETENFIFEKIAQKIETQDFNCL